MRYLVVVVAACLLLAGCGLELLGAAAIRSGTEAEQIKAMDRQIHNAAGSMGKVNLQRAVDTYQAEKGVWPPSLDALVPGYVPSMPRQADGSPFGYDPATGRVSDGPAPAANADAANLAALRNAINRYGQDSGYYPPSLQALVPRYITSVPVSASGQPYAYNPQNGYLAAPGGHARRAHAGPRSWRHGDGRSHGGSGHRHGCPAPAQRHGQRRRKPGRRLRPRRRRRHVAGPQRPPEPGHGQPGPLRIKGYRRSPRRGGAVR